MNTEKPRARRRRPPDPLDVVVSANIRRLRTAAGMTQAALGEEMGVSYQQIQKYEDGTDRVAASRLWKCAQALGVPVERLYEENALEEV